MPNFDMIISFEDAVSVYDVFLWLFLMISKEVLVVSRSIAYGHCWRNIKESRSRATFGEYSSTEKKLVVSDHAL